MNWNASTYILAIALLSNSVSMCVADTTFNRDVAPIVFDKCMKCHRPGEAAPFALQTYADVKNRGELIAMVVKDQTMPPWKAAPSDYAFRHNRSLSQMEIDTIVRWFQTGMAEGDSLDLPTMPMYPEGWQLGKPDLIVTMHESYTVPKDGPDIYRNFVIAIPSDTHERWVRAVEFRPSAPTVVHHSLFFIDSTGRAKKLDEDEKGAGFKGGMGAIMRLRGNALGPVNMSSTRAPVIDRFKQARNGRLNKNDARSNDSENDFGTLGGWAIGAQPNVLPDGLAFRIPPNADLILATHFHPSGKEEHEQSSIGLYFADKPPVKSFTGIQIPPAFGAFKDIDIPANQSSYVIEDSFELPCDVRAFGAGAHAHYIGKSMKMTAIFPNGDVQTLLHIPDWDFAWQEQYQFAQFVDLPKGTRLHCRIEYDNSSSNDRNPYQPPRRVQFGEESTDEMGSMSLLVVASDESDMPDLRASYKKHFQESVRMGPLLKIMQKRIMK